MSPTHSFKNIFILDVDFWNPQRGPVTCRNWVNVVIQKHDPIPQILGAKVIETADMSRLWEGTISVSYDFPLNIGGDILNKLFLKRLGIWRKKQNKAISKYKKELRAAGITVDDYFWDYPYKYYPRQKQK